MSDVGAGDGKIKCMIDGAMTHSIQVYLKKTYPDMTVQDYQAKFPGAPLMSEKARTAVLAEQKRKAAMTEDAKVLRKNMSDIFGLPTSKTKNGRGDQIQVRVFRSDELSGEDAEAMIPDRDDNYVFPIEYTKVVLMAFELNKTMYIWGYHGTGKTTLFEQVAAGTRRPFLRVQHTIGTEESHILGQYIVRDGATIFNLGPLPMAMINGWVYCADEYDAAIPAVSMLYQPVLEGKQLYIKDAPPELRIIKPHPNFRFVATGNTNGSGDETGLYQGTQIQNAANYSRFNITIEADYPEAGVEAALVAKQSGVKMEDAKKIIQYANEWRKAYKGGQVSLTVSSRELIQAAHQGMILGGNWHQGIGYAFANRLSRTDKEVAKQLAQRMFGNAD